MRKFLMIICFCALFFSNARAQTQSPTSLAGVHLRLWPEFDKPSMLVIYNLTLSTDTKLPAEVQFRIPASAEAPHAVASVQPDGALFNLPYEQDQSGDWTIITFNATTPEVQLEYYDPSLTKDGSNRHFEYFWPGDFAVDNFKIQVQEPIGAKDMQLSPSLGPGQQAGDGMTYYSQDIGALALGQTFSITMDYQKNSDTLSAENVPIEASGSLETTSPGSQALLSTYLPLVLGFLGLVLIIGGGFWYWQSGRKESGSRKNFIPRRRKASAESSESTTAGAHIYCHQCGNRAQPGDQFCRACGTQLRLG